MKPKRIKLTPIEEKIDVLLVESGRYLQTYRAIDALRVLNQALALVEGNEVKWQVKVPVYRDMGQALYQQGQFDQAMQFFVKSYETAEDGNSKASVAGEIAGYYLQADNKSAAMDYAQKALETATASELLAETFQIKGGIAILEGDYPKALELMNKAAAYAEKSHCITQLAMIIMDISVIFMKMDRKETALSEIYRAERYVKGCHNLDLYLRCAIRRAKILYSMGRDEDARKLVCALDEQKC